MSSKKENQGFSKKTFEWLELILGMSGFRLKHATIARTLSIIISVLFTIYLSIKQPNNKMLAFAYFFISVTIYISFITIVLKDKGLKLWFIKKWGKQKGYLIYEGILGFIFYNAAMSIGYVALATSGNMFDFLRRELVILIALVLFLIGIIVKIWATKITTIETYYWKDMFLEEKVTEYVVGGPYKYLNNPMYGIGQLQGYAIAIYYGSVYGIIAAGIYQIAIFIFYFKIEKEFIKKHHGIKK